MVILDLHTHSEFSDGKISVAQIVEIANSFHYKVGIADHYGPCDKLFSEEALTSYLEYLQKFPVYKSIELDLGKEPVISHQALDKLDYVIGGVHHWGEICFFDGNASVEKPEQLIEGILRLLEKSMEHYHLDILAHPTLLPISLKEKITELIFQTQWAERLIALACEKNVALEISARWPAPDEKFYEMAMRKGVKFSLGSDGHNLEKVCRLEYPLNIVRKLNIPESQIFRPLSTNRSPQTAEK
ncbi:MAG: PHP domain-containing protein [Candidatus Edwardsbacteria bacterium]